MPLLVYFHWYGNLNFHWLKMGKVKIGIHGYLNADFLAKILQKYSLFIFLTYHILLIQTL